MFKYKNHQKINKPLEHCAVFGVTCDDETYSISKLLYLGLISLQHRGQESTGISILKTGGNIVTYKEKGLVSKVLNDPDEVVISLTKATIYVEKEDEEEEDEVVYADEEEDEE